MSRFEYKDGTEFEQLSNKEMDKYIDHFRNTHNMVDPSNTNMPLEKMYKYNTKAQKIEVYYTNFDPTTGKPTANAKNQQTNTQTESNQQTDYTEGESNIILPNSGIEDVEAEGMSQAENIHSNMIQLPPNFVNELAKAMILAKSIEEKGIEEPIRPVEPNRSDFNEDEDYENALETYDEEYSNWVAFKKDYMNNPIQKKDIAKLNENVLYQTGTLQELSQQQNEIIERGFNSLDQSSILTQQNEVIQRGFDNVSNYMNPYRNMDKRQMVEEYEKLGFKYLGSMDKETIDDLSKKLNFAKEIELQSKALVEYKLNNPPYIEKGFDRLNFDTFSKVNKENPRDGTPLSKTYKFIQKGIPEIKIQFNSQTGVYDAIQGKESFSTRHYKDMDRWALSGGYYSSELKELRKIRIGQEKPESIKYKNYFFGARRL